MPSQEERLDQLLKGIVNVDEDGGESMPDPLDLGDLSNIDELFEMPDLPDIDALLAMSGMDESDAASALDVPDDVVSVLDMPDLSALIAAEGLSGADEEMGDEEPGGMSEEEIDQILNANRTADSQGDDVPDHDLLSLLDESSKEDDLREIHDLLQKSDNNEAVDESVAAVLREDADGERTHVSADTEGAGELSEREKKSLEKKRLKEEKAAAKKAAKEAKKAEKEAKKAAKLAEKEAKLLAAEGLNQTGRTETGTESLAGLENASDAAGGSRTDGSEPDVFGPDDLSELDDLLGLHENDVVGSEELEAEEDAPEDPLGEDIISQLEGTKEAGNGKKGFFARILDFLTEEDEEEEERTERGTEDVPMSDENKNILEEMDKEPGKKGKKGKKPKKEKKGKKDKKSEGKDAENEDAEGEEAGGGKKAKKAKKAPKEKAPKEKLPEDPKNKISIKRIMPIALTCASILLIILLLANLGGDFFMKRNARKAYYQEDYETCYQELYGKRLNETEKVMFGKSESILRIRLWMREYELYVAEGAEAEALDSLIQSVNDYAVLYDYASRWNAEGDVSTIYGQMLGILQQKYGLTEALALEIAAEPDDVEYTKKVYAVLNPGDVSGGGGESSVPVTLPDMLPEERNFPENNGGR